MNNATNEAGEQTQGYDAPLNTALTLQLLRDIADKPWAKTHLVIGDGMPWPVSQAAEQAIRIIQCAQVAAQAEEEMARTQCDEAAALERDYRTAVATVQALDRRLGVATALLREVKCKVALPAEMDGRMAGFFKGDA